MKFRAFSFFLLLLLLLHISSITCTNDNFNGNITRGSTLYTNGSADYWESQLAAFGFFRLICKSSSPDCPQDRFVIGIKLKYSEYTNLHWVSFRNTYMPASILFTEDGKLILHTLPDDSVHDLIPEVTESVAYAKIEDSGNFVLYGTKSEIIWQSDDYPSKSHPRAEEITWHQKFLPVRESPGPNDPVVETPILPWVDDTLPPWVDDGRDSSSPAPSPIREPTPTREPSPAVPPSAPHSSASIRTILIFTIPSGIAVLAIMILVAFCCFHKKAPEKNLEEGTQLSTFVGQASDENEFHENPEIAMFTFGTLSVATNNFSAETQLGFGGFGIVYKAKLVNGQEVAVKRLSKGSKQGLVEFKNEVEIISKLQHKNLVRLVGCCIEGAEKLLVYEYLPNKSLDSVLYDPNERAHLSWRKCSNIIEGITRGILYLHQDSRLKVIHRDLKASNVLLDEHLNPKISDFGLARVFGDDQLQADTSRIVGTHGYMAPEYAIRGRMSKKSDVFSFGVLVIEIVSGKRQNTSVNLQGSSSSLPQENKSLTLLGYAWELWKKKKIHDLIDGSLFAESVHHDEMVKYIHVGLLCVQEDSKYRPTMRSILNMLLNEIANLPEPKQPPREFLESSSAVSVHNKSGNQGTTSGIKSANEETMSSIVGR